MKCMPALQRTGLPTTIIQTNRTQVNRSFLFHGFFFLIAHRFPFYDFLLSVVGTHRNVFRRTGSFIMPRQMTMTTSNCSVCRAHIFDSIGFSLWCVMLCCFMVCIVCRKCNFFFNLDFKIASAFS